MTQEQLIAQHLEKLSKLNPAALSHLEQATRGAESLEHVLEMTAKAVSLAQAGKPVTVKSITSDYVQPHNLSFLIKATRKLLTGNSEVLDGSGNRCSLPAPFFALVGYEGGADYKRMLLPYIPSNVIINSVLPTVDGLSLVVSYKDVTTNNVETMTIAMNANKSYLSLLIGSRTAFMTLTEPKIKIDNVSQADFFDEAVIILDQSLSGKKGEDDFTPNVFEPAVTPNETMRQIGHEFAIDNEKGFAFMMTPNYKRGQTDQVNGQFWTANLICLSSGWTKVGNHPGL